MGFMDGGEMDINDLMRMQMLNQAVQGVGNMFSQIDANKRGVPYHGQQGGGVDPARMMQLQLMMKESQAKEDERKRKLAAQAQLFGPYSPVAGGVPWTNPDTGQVTNGGGLMDKLPLSPEQRQLVQAAGMMDPDKAVGLMGEFSKPRDPRQGFMTAGDSLYDVRSGSPVPVANTEKKTEVQRNLEAAGLVPGTPAYQKALLEYTNKPLATVAISAEKAENQKIGGGIGEEYLGVRERGNSAAETLDTIRQTRAVAAPTGKFAAARDTLGGVLREFGYKGDLAKDATDLQKLNQITSNYVLGKQLEQKGVQSESDARRMRDTFAQITNTEEANDFILRAVESQKTREMEKADFYEQWRAGKGGSVDGAAGAWRKHIRETPVVGVNPNSKQPVFLHEFMDQAAKANPGMSEDQILQVWKQKYGGR
jgi:hypothetical protein